MGRPHPALIELAAGRRLPAAEWDTLLPSAIEHHMTGLLWSRVQSGEVPCPQPWKDELAGRDVVVRAHHRRLWNAAAAIAAPLHDIGVDWCLVKGVPVEARWYARTGERPCRDLDIFIAPQDVALVEDVVAVLDPARARRSSVTEPLQRGVVQSVDLVFEGVAVDLHADLLRLGPPSPHPGALWEHVVGFEGGEAGAGLRVPDAELSLVHLLVHLNRDSFCWLLGFADVARILEDETLDWHALETLVRDEGVEAPVYEGLAVVAETLGLPAPHAQVPGWRSALWRVVWRPSVRLGGDLGWASGRHRAHWLPVVC
ncbi:MAG: hypothetical protein QOJ00_1501, partial [Actinomycetota bacterium]